MHNDSHYSKLAIQPREYNRKNNLKYDECNIVKYITRHQDKGKADDILKVISHCLFILKDEYDLIYEMPKPVENVKLTPQITEDKYKKIYDKFVKERVVDELLWWTQPQPWVSKPYTVWTTPDAPCDTPMTYTIVSDAPTTN